jgi:hypothetical protein
MFSVLKDFKLQIFVVAMIAVAAVFNDGRRPHRLGWLYDYLGPTEFMWTIRGVALLAVCLVIVAIRSRLRADRRIERFVDQRARLEPEKRIVAE